MTLSRFRQRLVATSPLLLAREAVLRVSKRVRIWRFENQVQVPPIHFRPIGNKWPSTSDLPADDSDAIIQFANLVLGGEFPLLGYGNPKLGFPPKWNLDWVSGKEWPFERSGLLQTIRNDGSDIKAPWELSRLQFLPVLARAHRITGEEHYRSAIYDLALNWIATNPVGIGVNWTIAMEVALRGISLCLTLDLLWPISANEEQQAQTIVRSLWQHLRFIEAHNEFSHLIRSNHYLSNLVGLTTLSAALGQKKRFNRYARATQKEILHQTYVDGGDYEASIGYHVLVFQMFAHSWQVQKSRGFPIHAQFEQRLKAMLAFINKLIGKNGVLPNLGDCDDGRVELLLEDIKQAHVPANQRNSLKIGSCLYPDLIGDPSEDFSGSTQTETTGDAEPKYFLWPESGIARAEIGNMDLIVAAMPNGIRGIGSHTHNDKLSFALRCDQGDIFIDSGTRFYSRDAKLRNAYRSARSHNVLIIDGLEQNSIDPSPNMLFRCGNEAAVSPLTVQHLSDSIVIKGSHEGFKRIGCVYSRTYTLQHTQLFIEDVIEGSGIRDIELFFHLDPQWSAQSESGTETVVRCGIVGPYRMVLMCSAAVELHLAIEPAEISRAYGAFMEAVIIRISAKGKLPLKFSTQIRYLS